MISFRATLACTLFVALLGCTHSSHYNYPPPHPPSPVLDLSSIQQPVTQIEQSPEALDIQKTQENPKEIIQEPAKEDESALKRSAVRKKRGIDKGLEENALVRLWIERLAVKDRDAFKSSLTRLDKIRPTMERIFKQYGVPKEMVYLCLVESNANPHAVSISGATGYWQFIPDTAKKYGLQVNRYVDERKHLEKSTHAAAQYLKHLYSIFGDWYLAIAAYNAGEGAVIRLMKNHKVYTYWDIKSSMGIKPETIDYVPKYIATLILANNRETYGLPKPAQDTGMPEGVDSAGYLDTIARSNGSTPKVYGEGITGAGPDNALSFQTSDSSDIEHRPNRKSSRKNLEALNVSEDDNNRISYKVRKGDTLYSLARRYSTSAEDIAETNNLSSKQSLKVGKTILIPEGTARKNPKDNPNQDRMHIVAKGETIKSISSDYGVTGEDIIRANSIKDPDRISPKTRLAIPSPKGKHANVKSIKYKVRKGDTLWGISKQFDVSTFDILRWNRLTSTAQIKPGDRLTIYHQ